MVRLRLTSTVRARLLIILGAASIVYGAASIYLPLGFLVAGASLVLIGLFLVDVEGTGEPGTAPPLRPRR